jgi:hypothetical protein
LVTELVWQAASSRRFRSRVHADSGHERALFLLAGPREVIQGL